MVLWQERGPSMGQLGALEKKARPDGYATAGRSGGEFQLPNGTWERRPPAREASEGRLTMIGGV